MCEAVPHVLLLLMCEAVHHVVGCVNAQGAVESGVGCLQNVATTCNSHVVSGSEGDVEQDVCVCLSS